MHNTLQPRQTPNRNETMADGAAESTKELTDEGAKVTTVAEGTDATAAPPAEPVASPPESIAIFFDGEPMAGKAETWTTEHVADAATLQFVGPHALPLPLFDKAGFGSANRCPMLRRHPS